MLSASHPPRRNPPLPVRPRNLDVSPVMHLFSPDLMHHLMHTYGLWATCEKS